MDQDRGEAFVLLFTQHEVDVRSYVTMLLPRFEDVGEVMQQVSLHLWRKFADFDGGDDPHRAFVAWAFQIASYEVFNYRRKQQRDKLLFSDELLLLVADARAKSQSHLEQRRTVLADCLARLKPYDRELVCRRYMQGTKTNVLAAERGQPADSIYKALKRIRQQLFECINRKVNAGELT
jgi:RNA polymerase sigma-70 factor (ECF subfamily)